MKRTTMYITRLCFIALAALLWSGCADDELQRSNQLGSQLTENDSFKLSTFPLPKGVWALPDADGQIKIRLQSHTDASVQEYDASVEDKGDDLAVCLYIPKGKEIPDSDYDLTAFRSDGLGLGTKLKVTFRDEMLYAVMATAVEYGLRGEGTPDSPYQIGSSDDFAQFEYDLSRDSLEHGAGRYFRQTADFDAPPRSDAYEGRYYAGYRFAGSYDGDGHSITIPYIGSQEEKDRSIGLFRSLCNGAEIKHLVLKPRMQGILSEGGALAGMSQDSVLVTDVTVDGSITGCGERIGGFVGYATGCLTLRDCRLFAEVNGTRQVGGVVGCLEKGLIRVEGLSNLREDYSTSLFTVNAQEQSAGGIAGAILNGGCELSDIELQHAISEEDVNLKVIYAAGGKAGGVAGEAEISRAGYLRGVRILAPVRSEQSEVGGLMGRAGLSADLTVQNCTVGSLVKGSESVGGFFGHLSSYNHLILDGKDRTNRVVQVDNGYIAIEGKKRVGGMFGNVEGDIQARVISLINANVTASEQFGGGVAGRQYKNTLEGSRFAIDPNMRVQGADAIGGLVGFAESSTIRGRTTKAIDFSSLPSEFDFESDFAGTVTSGGASDGSEGGDGTSMGGIVGYAYDTYLENLCATGKVFGREKVGGIVGHLRNLTRGHLHNCVANMEAIKNTKGNYTGGIVGRLSFARGDHHHLVNFKNVEGRNYTGGIIGSIEFESSPSDFKLEYAVNKGNVSGGNITGGCVGRLEYDNDKSIRHTISNSANYGKVTNSGDGNIGGIIGQGNASKISVLSCANHGDIAGGSGSSKVGGIAGRLGRDPGGATIDDNMEMAYCCNRGTISSGHKDSHVGGLLGYQEEGNDSDDTHWMTHDCYNAGHVSSDHNKDTGGILGCIDHYGEIVRCINIGSVSHGNGVVGTHKDGSIWFHHDLYYLDGTGKGWCADSFPDDKKKDQGTFDGLDFKSTWAIDSDDKMNKGFPYLRNCPFQSLK